MTAVLMSVAIGWCGAVIGLSWQGRADADRAEADAWDDFPVVINGEFR